MMFDNATWDAMGFCAGGCGPTRDLEMSSRRVVVLLKAGLTQYECAVVLGFVVDELLSCGRVGFCVFVWQDTRVRVSRRTVTAIDYGFGNED